MSYASAARNALNTADPKPDPNGIEQSPVSYAADDGAKVNVVSKKDPATSENAPSSDSSPSGKKKPNRRLQEAKAEGIYLCQLAKNYLFRPGVAGGLVGVGESYILLRIPLIVMTIVSVNIGLLAGASRAFYTDPSLRRDPRAISATAVATLALLTAEGYAVEKYQATPRGQAELRSAKEEGTLIYRHLSEQILRPGVLGGLLGLLNAGIIGAIGYFSYINWDKPTWDRRVTSAISVGLFALWGGEGVIAERYHVSKK
ncbi:hypothetical protein BDZ89DRAFT_1125997 [Hymenopellis radicata]|nr:hypothetical protein BDZ89DRAFT_1125997 [Hymenopellis radicata]